MAQLSSDIRYKRATITFERQMIQFSLILLVFAALCKGDVVGASDRSTYELIDRLGWSWSNERVRFPLSYDQAQRATRGETLVSGDGRPVAFELINDAKGFSIEFLADLPRFGSTTYRLQSGVTSAKTDLVVEEHDGEIQIFNAKGGVAIRTRLVGDEAPIRAFKAPSGSWVGSSRFVSTGDPIVSYMALIERRGPVAAIVRCRTTFASGVTWDLALTLQAGDPSIVIDEEWSTWEHSNFQIVLGSEFPATHIYFRKGSGADVGRLATATIRPEKGNRTFDLQPWLQWWISERRGTWVALYGDLAPDSLIIAALRGDIWVAPSDIPQKRKLEPISITHDQNTVIDLPGRGQRRKWLVASMPRNEAIIDHGLIGTRVAPPPQRLVVRHGDFPLDRIKDLPLVWAGAPASDRQRLLLTTDDIKRMRVLGGVNAEQVRRLMRIPLTESSLGIHLETYLRSGAQSLGQKLSAAAPGAMQSAVDYFLEQSEQLSLGFAPHHARRLLYAAHLADIALADRWLEGEVRERLRAQAAFLSDIVHRPDYWSPERSFSANPNMTSIVAGYQGLLACLLYDHPKFGEWRDAALTELFNRQLLRWSDANGGWLEAPHYAVLSYDHMLAVFACIRNLGKDNYLFDPRMRKIIEWLAKITTPPNSRIGGRRHLPPIGNTYILEPTGQFGTVAHIWRNHDPAFSEQMQWMHRASGSPVGPGVGGFSPALGAYQTIWKDSELPFNRPAYGSELFPKTGAILRSHFGTDRETQLHIIAGSNHAHYDDDSGSITLWGKGRVIANDFGYYGRAPARDHSMVELQAAGSIMNIESFSSFKELDAVRGVNGQWTRQIVFLKDPDPLGANFYILRDEVAGGRGGTWRLYLNAIRLEMDGERVRAIGHEDVDTDIFFLSGLSSEMKLENVTRTSSSSFYNRPYATSQTALVVKLPEGKSAIAVLLYPRLKGSPSPIVRTNESGRVVDIESTIDQRTVFLSREAFKYDRPGISFEGTVGAAIKRSGVYALAVGARGRISAFGRVLASEDAQATEWMQTSK